MQFFSILLNILKKKTFKRENTFRCDPVLSTCCTDVFWFISKVIYARRRKQGFCCVWSMGAEHRAGLSRATWGRIMNHNMWGAREEIWKTAEGFVVVFFGVFPFHSFNQCICFYHTGFLCCTVCIKWTRNVHVNKYGGVLQGRWKIARKKSVKAEMQWYESVIPKKNETTSTPVYVQCWRVYNLNKGCRKWFHLW